MTVTGPGGVGKSRLAQDVGWRLATVVDGVTAVDLSALRSPEDVLPALAAALGCRTAGWSPAEAVAATIGDARWLLILDSFEHVVDAATDLAELLVRCRRLTALVTSRTPLSLRGEHIWPLPPLPVPAIGDPDPAASPAVRLLLERTAAVRPGFALTTGNAADLVTLCRSLDGLPLAIELAAAQLRTLAHDRGAYETAVEHYAASLAIKREIGDARGTAVTLLNSAGVENDLGRYAAAVEHLTAVVTWFRDADEPAPAAFAQAMLAEALLGAGDTDAAEAAATEALDRARTVDYRAAIGLATARLGDVALARGEPTRAEELLLTALNDAVGPAEQARTLDRLAAEVATVDPERAAGFGERARALRREHDIAVPFDSRVSGR